MQSDARQVRQILQAGFASKFGHHDGLQMPDGSAQAMTRLMLPKVVK